MTDFSNGLRIALAALSLTAAVPQAQAQQADGGKIFRLKCQMCHASAAGQKSGMGPNLAGVVGRKAASTDFLYSPALKGSGLVWDKATLDKFLAAPAKLVPGTRMAIAVPADADRTALIGYLASLRK